VGGVIPSSATLKRTLGRVLRTAAVLDRRGLRWLLNALSPAPVIVLVHRGRRSGRIYRTPVEALAVDPDRGELVVSPMWGEQSDWYRNVVAGGLIEISVGGRAGPTTWRHLSPQEKERALATYRRRHRAYSSMILQVLRHLQDLDGRSDVEVARALPMLALLDPTRSAHS